MVVLGVVGVVCDCAESVRRVVSGVDRSLGRAAGAAHSSLSVVVVLSGVVRPLGISAGAAHSSLLSGVDSPLGSSAGAAHSSLSEAVLGSVAVFADMVESNSPIATWWSWWVVLCRGSSVILVSVGGSACLSHMVVGGGCVESVGGVVGGLVLVVAFVSVIVSSLFMGVVSLLLLFGGLSAELGALRNRFLLASRSRLMHSRRFCAGDRSLCSSRGVSWLAESLGGSIGFFLWNLFLLACCSLRMHSRRFCSGLRVLVLVVSLSLVFVVVFVGGGVVGVVVGMVVSALMLSLFGVVGVLEVVVAGLSGVGVDFVDFSLQVGSVSAEWCWLQSCSSDSMGCG